jgi:predicted PurR-regulated permease PerM
VNTDRNQLLASLLQVLCVGALMLASYAILRPFLPALVWATVIVVATWPLLKRLEVICRGRRRLAIALMTLALLLVIVLPITWLLSTLITHMPQLRELVTGWISSPLPPPPSWLSRLPFGDRLVADWQQLAASTPTGMMEQLRPYVLRSVQWMGSHVGDLGSLLLEFALTLVFIVVFYINSDELASWVRRLAHRIGGVRSEESVVLAAETMGAIAAGVVLTALAQAIISGIGLLATGVPAAGVLTSVVFMCCIVQIGTLPVLVPAVVWLFYRGDTGWAVALAVWTAALTIGDGFLRAWLIQRGAKLPFLLIFAGVIGGLLAFGMVGIFIGPILLAAALRLLQAWVDGGEADTP